MRNIQKAVAAVVLAGAVAGGTYAFFGSSLVPSAMARWHDHPKLEGAFNSLKEAREYLEHAPHDFHGHKADAIHAIDEAMHQLRACAEEAQPTPSTADLSPLEAHPRLHEAREHLKEAREYLHDAAEDFHGHKHEAIGAIDKAIEEIDHCMAE